MAFYYYCYFMPVSHLNLTQTVWCLNYAWTDISEKLLNLNLGVSFLKPCGEQELSHCRLHSLQDMQTPHKEAKRNLHHCDNLNTLIDLTTCESCHWLFFFFQTLLADVDMSSGEVSRDDGCTQHFFSVSWCLGCLFICVWTSPSQFV